MLRYIKEKKRKKKIEYSNVNPQVVIPNNPGIDSKPEVKYIEALCGRVAAQLLVN